MNFVYHPAIAAKPERLVLGWGMGILLLAAPICILATYQRPLATVAVLTAAVVLVLATGRPYLVLSGFLVSSFFITTVTVKFLGASLHVSDIFFFAVWPVFLKHYFFRRQEQPPADPIISTAFLVFVFALFAALLGVLRGNPISLIPSELRPFAYYLVVFPARIFLRDIEARKRLVRHLIMGAMVATCWGIIQTITEPYLTGSTYELGPISFGRLVWPLLPTFLPMQFALVSIVLLSNKEFHSRALLKACFLLSLFAIFLSLTRGVILAFGLSLLAVVAVSRGVWLRRQVFAVLLLCVAFITAADFATGHAFMNRLLIATEGNDLNILQRVYETKQVVDRISEHPLLGSGLGALHSNDFPLEPPEDMRFWLNPTICHNCYLYFWWKLGLPGIVSILLLLFLALRRSFQVLRHSADKPNRTWGLLIFGIIISTIAVGVSSPVLYDDSVVPLFVSLVALAAILPIQRSDRSAVDQHFVRP